MRKKFRLRRVALRKGYTIGKLELWDGMKWIYLCDTLEDEVREPQKNRRNTAVASADKACKIDCERADHSSVVAFAYKAWKNGSDGRGRDGDVSEWKVAGQTAIPYGTYEVTMNVRSGKFANFSRYPYARKYDAHMPRLLRVRGFEGILIHPGSTAADTQGCILVGKNKEVGRLVESQAVWKWLMDSYFMPAKTNNEKISVEII